MLPVLIHKIIHFNTFTTMATKFNNVIRDFFNTTIVTSTNEMNDEEILNTFPLISGHVYTIVEGYIIKSNDNRLYVHFIDELGFIRTISLRHLAKLWYHEHHCYTYNMKTIAEKIINGERIEFTYISVGR